jgi:hypothetical protein
MRLVAADWWLCRPSCFSAVSSCWPSIGIAGDALAGEARTRRIVLMPVPTVTRSAALEGFARPLDGVRRVLLRTAWSWPVLGRAMRSVEIRVPLLASMSVSIALLATCFAPGVLFVLGPALLGVPHVASDVRYLVLRQPRPIYWTATVALGAAVLISVRIAEMMHQNGGLAFALVEVATGWAWIGMAAWMGAWSGASPRRWRRASLVTLPIAMAAAMAIARPELTRALLAYGHNLVAPVIWIVLFRRHKMRGALPIALLLAGAGLLLSGITVPLLPADGPWVAALVREAQTVAPALAPTKALGMALSYVFLQAVHYSIWLVWIPQEKIRGNATLTFRMSLRAARRDLGACGIALVAGASLAMIAASFVAVHRTRHFYLSLATFHAYLELACLAFLVTQRPGGAERSTLPIADWRAA